MHQSRSTSIRFALVATAMLWGVAASGCATLAMDLPGEFLVLPDDGDGMRATTPNEARVWLREHNAPPGAELPFWRAALKRNLVDGRGYTIVEEKSVKDGAGREGVELLCEGQIGGVPHRYLLTVFVLPTSLPFLFDDTIRTVEYAAEKKDFDQHLAAVRQGIGALR